MKYEEYIQKCLSLYRGNKNERSKFLLSDLRHVLRRCFFLVERLNHTEITKLDKEEDVCQMHSEIYSYYIVKLEKSLVLNDDFPECLESIGLMVQDQELLCERISKLIHALGLGSNEETCYCNKYSSEKNQALFGRINSALVDWVNGIHFDAMIKDRRVALHLAYEALNFYLIKKAGHKSRFPYIIKRIKKHKLSGSKSKGSLVSSYEPKGSRQVENRQINDLFFVLSSLQKEPLAWVSIFSKGIHWILCEGEYSTTYYETHRKLLMKRIQQCMEQIKSRDTEDIISNVERGLVQFENLADQSGFYALGGSRSGRVSNDVFRRYNRKAHWMWGRSFCERVLEIADRNETSNIKPIAGLLLQALPKASGRRKNKLKYLSSRQEIIENMMNCLELEASIVKPTLELLQKDVPPVYKIENRFKQLWKDIETPSR